MSLKNNGFKNDSQVKNIILIILGLFIILIFFIFVVNSKKDIELNMEAINQQAEEQGANLLLTDTLLGKLNKLNEILNCNSATLIYRYPNDVCSSCYHEDLSELSNFQKAIGKNNVMVLPAYPDNRNNRIMLYNELAKFNYRNISTDSVYIPKGEDGFLKRYFALINKDGSIDMVFFPKRGHGELTRLYLEEIKRKMKE